MKLQQSIEKAWYQGGVLSFILLPLSGLYRLLVAIKRWAYSSGVFRQERLPVPVIIVGNISVGGTGKTPLVLYLIQLLKSCDYSPGIISRGYGGNAGNWPQSVTPQSDPGSVGDEPVLLARHCDCPVVVGPDRVAAARQLLAENSCNIIIADDGLQHYRLGRDLEIAVIDGQRLLGNKHCLPAGPLREPAKRLASVDIQVVNQGHVQDAYSMQLEQGTAVNLEDPQKRQHLAKFSSAKVHAVAAIGNPSRFFQQLRQHGLEVVEHPFPDHYPFTAADFAFARHEPVLMTEKDAVKCQAFATDNLWYVPVVARLQSGFDNRVLQILKRIQTQSGISQG